MADATDPSPELARPHPARQRSRHFYRDLLIIIVVAVLASFLIKTFLVRSFYIPSGSMMNTLLINDRVLVDELVPGVIPLQRGDVIVFTDPGGWLPTATPAATTPLSILQDGLSYVGLGTEDSDNHLIKRVIGLPGDHIACCNAKGQVTVNGHAIDEPYLLLPTPKAAASLTSFSVTVPAGDLWVLGDNRYSSEDSRFHPDTPTKGFVPESDVVGRAFVISWPITRWNVLGAYPDTFKGIPAPTK